MRRILCGALVLVVVVMGAPPASARTDDRAKPIVYVHGFDPSFSPGYNCSSYWDTMANQLEAWGHTGERATVAYYYLDYNCTYSLDHHGSHSKHHAGGHYLGSHTRNTSIRHLGYHLAWMIYDHFTVNGQAVDVVGHSMGGLITRYALAGVARGDSAFPPSLLVEDVVTLGTPHAGTGWAYFCGYTQCYEMRPGSSFMKWLENNAQNPQTTGGTDWTVQSSEEDGIVSASSGVSMGAEHKVIYRTGSGIGHGDFVTNTSDDRTAKVYWQDGNNGVWYSWSSAPYPVRWTDYALLYGTW